MQGEVQDEVRMLLCETLGMQEGVGFAIGLTKAFFHTREAEFLLEVKVLVEQRATAALQPFFLGALARHRHARERAAARKCGGIMDQNGRCGTMPSFIEACMGASGAASPSGIIVRACVSFGSLLTSGASRHAARRGTCGISSCSAV